MKFPNILRQQLAKEWQKESCRLERLLGNDFPCQFNIGLPTATDIAQHIMQVREYLTAWHEIEKFQIGEIKWEEKSYKQIGITHLYPKYWQLNCFQDWINAVEDHHIQKEMKYYESLLQHDYIQHQLQVNDVSFVQQFTILIKSKNEVLKCDISVIIQLLILSKVLYRNCFQGLPLRSVHLMDLKLQYLTSAQLDYLSDLELDSKYFERNKGLLTKLLDVLYQGEVSQMGLSKFLGVEQDNAHWLRLYEGEFPTKWLITQHMRIRDCDLNPENIPFHTILIIENEQCVYLLPKLKDVLVILGAGRNLKWLDNPAWHAKHLFYWGDLDSWGMAMLAQVQSYQPHSIAIMMDRETLNHHQDKIVTEPVNYRGEPQGLTSLQYQLFTELRQHSWRLEQEFIQRDWIKSIIYTAFKQQGIV